MTALLTAEATPVLTDLDRQVFGIVVPQEHYLRQVALCVDFERFRPHLAKAYSPDQGRPAIDPVCMLKILFLRFQYHLSDRQVMERTKTDLAFRWFLGFPLDWQVPNHTGGTYFRKRIGADRFLQIFQELIRQAREAGLVKDRLRLKDVTHLLADVTDQQPLQLVAQVRERLLQSACPLFSDWVGQQRSALDTLRQTTAEFGDDERLAARLEHLRDLAEQLRERLPGLPAGAASDKARARLERALDLVGKLLADREEGAQDRLVSAVDPEARVGKHGSYFVGYLLDLTLDPDSELITNLNVLPANGAEAADAVALIQQEEAAQGNDVETLSMDGAGYNGPVLRELTAPQGLNLNVVVPPPAPAPRTTFGPERFSLQVIDSQHAELTCPAGQKTRHRSRTRHGTGYRYRFSVSQCGFCELRDQCLVKGKKRGRVVIKNDYEPEYQKVQEQAQTAFYQETRRIHPKIERKLGEVVRHHWARRARFRGRAKVLTQAAVTALAVNIKRMVKLRPRTIWQPAAMLTARAELACT
jgi:transposase